MKVILCSLLALSLIRSATLPAHGETERPRRGPIRYDERVQWDQLDPGIRVRGDQEAELLRVPERREADYSDRSGSFFTMDPSMLSAPPPPVREESDRQRNWLLPSLGEDFGLSGEAAEEEREPSGWGWLADEVNERRQAARDAEEEGREEVQDDEENFWSPQETGLFGGVRLTFTPVLAERAGDPEGERNDTLSALNSREIERFDEMSPEELEELLRDQESTDQWDSPDEDDPWGDDRLRESATSPLNSKRTSSERFTGSRFRERERVDEGRRQSGFNNRTETRISAGRLDQPEETWSFSPSADRHSGDRTFRGTERSASFDSSFHSPRDNGFDRDFGSVDAGSMSTPSRESTSGWGGNWTSDSDWQRPSPITAIPDRTRPSPATPPTPDSDWLSDPGW